MPDLTAAVADDVSYIGSGSIPDEGIPTRVVRLRHAHIAADTLARRLRQYVPPIFTRLADREVILDMRTLRGDAAAQVIVAVRVAAGMD